MRKSEACQNLMATFPLYSSSVHIPFFNTERWLLNSFFFCSPHKVGSGKQLSDLLHYTLRIAKPPIPPQSDKGVGIKGDHFIAKQKEVSIIGAGSTVPHLSRFRFPSYLFTIKQSTICRVIVDSSYCTLSQIGR